MLVYYVDANVFLRFLLKDNDALYHKAEQYFKDAQARKIELILTTEILLEINYVLKGVYAVSRQETGEKLKSIILTSYITVIDREILIKALDIYRKINVDLADIILYEKAVSKGVKVLSFDTTDMKKIMKASSDSS